MSPPLSPFAPDEARALVELHEPEFVRNIESALAANGSVCLMLDGFKNNREVITACFWLALDSGVLVTVVPRVLRTPLPTSADVARLLDEPETRLSPLL